jgi:hypothetical protein
MTDTMGIVEGAVAELPAEVLAAELLDRASAEGVSLVGPGWAAGGVDPPGARGRLGGRAHRARGLRAV